MDKLISDAYVTLTVFLAILFLVAIAVAAWKKFYTPLSTSPPASLPSSSDLLFVFASYLFFHVVIFPVFISAAIALYFNGDKQVLNTSKEVQVLMNSIGIWGSLVFVLGACFFFKRTALKRVAMAESANNNIERLSFLTDGVLTWFLCYPVVFVFSHTLAFLIEAFLKVPDSDQVAVRLLKMSFDYPSLRYLYFAAVVIAAPLIEEFIFRGLLQRWFIGKVAPWTAIVLASIIFSLMHYSGSQGLYNLELIPSLFVLSCFLGYLYERYRSLIAPIGLHAMFNFMSASMLIMGE